jgi:hypothetical protein
LLDSLLGLNIADDSSKPLEEQKVMEFELTAPGIAASIVESMVDQIDN